MTPDVSILSLLPFTHEYQGLEFTFEVWVCRQWCLHMGVFIGQYSGHHYSQRVGICRKADSLTLRLWEQGRDTIQHVSYILEEEAIQAERQSLRDAVPKRSGSGIVIESFNRGEYSVRIHGLTRDQAIIAYKAALAALED